MSFDPDKFRKEPEKAEQYDPSRLILKNPYKVDSLAPMTREENEDLAEQFEELSPEFERFLLEVESVNIPNVDSKQLTIKDKTMWDKVQNRTRVPLDKKEFVQYYHSIEDSKKANPSRYYFSLYLYNLIK